MILYVTLDKNDWIENNIRCNDIGQFFIDAWEGIKATISDPKFWTQTAVAAALAVATGGQSIWVQAIVTGSGYTMTGEGYDFAGTGFDVEKFYELKGVDNAGEYWGGALFDCVLSSGDIYVGRKAFEYVKGGKGDKGYNYSKSVNDKADNLYHDFPSSLDDFVLERASLFRSDGRIEYLVHGSINGKDGIYHITTKSTKIIHRTFIPASDWSRYSQVNKLPSMDKIPQLKNKPSSNMSIKNLK